MYSLPCYAYVVHTCVDACMTSACTCVSKLGMVMPADVTVRPFAVHDTICLYSSLRTRALNC